MSGKRFLTLSDYERKWRHPTDTPSYWKISWNPRAERSGFRLFQSLLNLTGTSAAALQISEYDHYNIQSRNFETSRDLSVRRLTAQWIEAMGWKCISKQWYQPSVMTYPLSGNPTVSTIYFDYRPRKHRSSRLLVLFDWNLLVTGGFPTQRDSITESVSMS